MKLDAESQAKLKLLGILGGVGAVCLYFNLLILPLWTQRATLQDQVAKLEEKIRADSEEEKSLHAAERADEANAEFDALVERMVETAPRNPEFAASDRVIRAFKDASTGKTQAFLYMMLPFRIDPACLVYEFDVNAPDVDAVRLGGAVARFENQNPLARIDRLVIEPEGRDSSRQKASLVVQMIVRP